MSNIGITCFLFPTPEGNGIVPPPETVVPPPGTVVEPVLRSRINEDANVKADSKQLPNDGSVDICASILLTGMSHWKLNHLGLRREKVFLYM